MYTVLLDSDGVLYPFEKAFLSLYRERSWDRSWDDKCFDHWMDFKEFEDQKTVTDIWLEPKLFTMEDPYPGAVESVEKLCALEGVDVCICTSCGRRPEVIVHKMEWFRKWFPWIGPFNIIVAHKKHLIRGNLLLDDKLETVLKWKKANPQHHSVLLSRPWSKNPNHKDKVRETYVVVEGVGGILNIVQSDLEYKKAIPALKY